MVGISASGKRLRVDRRHRYQSSIVSTEFDYVINCSGPNPDPTKSEIKSFHNTVTSGLLTVEDAGVGLAVNERSETLRGDGGVNQQILALGPITKGRFPEIIAVPQITGHLALLTTRLVAEGLL